MKWISDLIDIIFPRSCTVCGKTLSAGEEELCLNCLMALPRTGAYTAGNEMEKQFYGLLAIERAASYISYSKGSPYNNLIHRMKYDDRPESGTRMAVAAATQLMQDGFFEGIDVIIPLPLSKKKKRQRGYNQCDYIAKGISSVTGIAVDTTSVVRHIANETQTHKRRSERWDNVQGIFSISNPEALNNKHALLVDDVSTTGATIASCGNAILAGASNVKLSIFTLARAGKSI